jgi:hypothetical protein
VDSPRAQKIREGRLTLRAGLRARGSRSYEQSRRPLAGAAISVNGVTLAGRAYPRTIWSDGSFEESVAADSFELDLKPGWNLVELFLTLADSTGIERDLNDSIDPYVELRLFPDLFHPSVRKQYGLGRLIATGNYLAVDEFDLEWNLNADSSAWAWSSGENRGIKTNTSLAQALIPLDGHFRGVAPAQRFFLETGTSPSATLWTRFDLERDPTSFVGPTLHGYRLYGV